MLSVAPGRSRGERLRVLCLGAHPDDIEIGCGGTLLQMASGPEGLEVGWFVFSATGDRRREAEASARRLLDRTAELEIEVLGFRDGFFPDSWGEIKEVFETLKERAAPDLVFTHYRHDRHQDHRIVSDLTWNTFRDHLILEYEVPKWDGDLGSPNVFSPLGADDARLKARHLLESFPSQREKPWFSEETFLGLSRLRGIECRAPEGHAEAFYGRKIVIDLDREHHDPTA